MVQAAFGAKAAAALPLYGYRDGKAPDTDPLLGNVPAQVMTDMWFRCPARWLAHRMRDAGTRVWRYEFGFGAPGSGKPPEHTTEMDYVYHARPSTTPPGGWPPVQRYWTNFIRNGAPNGDGLPVWPMAGERDGSLSIAPHGIAAEVGARAQVCDLMFQGAGYPPSAAVPN